MVVGQDHGQGDGERGAEGQEPTDQPREGQLTAALAKDNISEVGHQRQADHRVRLLRQRQQRQSAARQDQRPRCGPTGGAPERERAVKRQAQAQRCGRLREEGARIGPGERPQPPGQHGQDGSPHAERQPSRSPVKHSAGEGRHQRANQECGLNGVHGFQALADGQPWHDQRGDRQAPLEKVQVAVKSHRGLGRPPGLLPLHLVDVPAPSRQQRLCGGDDRHLVDRMMHPGVGEQVNHAQEQRQPEGHPAITRACRHGAPFPTDSVAKGVSGCQTPTWTVGVCVLSS